MLPPDEENRRQLVLRRLTGVVVGAFVIALLNYQVISAGAINTESKGNRTVTRTVEALRGSILDKDGNILAKSVYRYDINADPSAVSPVSRQVDGKTVTISVDQLAGQLAEILGKDKDSLLRKFAGTGKYVNLSKNVDATIYSKIKALDIPWIWPDAHPSRLYPNGAVAGNILGFITSDGATLAGIERKMNSCLAGVDGQETYERGSDGIRIPDSAVVSQKARNGGTLELTIDTNLQYFAQQVLANAVNYERADYGTALVVEVKTGKLLVAAEAPTVDPNDPGASDEADRQSRIFNSTYEPGSTMKTLTAATAIDTGVATVGTKVEAPFKVHMRWGTWIKDSEKHETLHLTLAGILRDSSNTGIMKIGELNTRAQRFEYMKRFGLGKKTSIDMAGESGGTLGNPKTWDDQTNYSSMFGQGIAVTPIQMAYAYQAIANKGVRLQPQLFEKCTAADGSVTNFPVGESVRVVSESAARDTVDMLEKVVEQGHIGRTAAVAGYRVGGKSGTAQTLDGNRYGNLYAISFIGMAPAEDPQYVVAVMLYKSRRTASSIGATPVFKQIMQQVLRTYRVAPSTTKSRNIPTEW
jgi:cell division protein FtsI (penicillin-binding protein 3)